MLFYPLHSKPGQGAATLVADALYAKLALCIVLLLCAGCSGTPSALPLQNDASRASSKVSSGGTSADLAANPAALEPPAPPTPPALPTLHSAASADRFVDSLGINTHLNWVGAAYWNYLTTPAPNGNTTITTLRNLGIRHIRDSLGTTSASFAMWTCGPMQTMGSNGASWDFYTNYQYAGDSISTTVASDLTGAVSCLSNPSKLMAFEGPNEIDGSGVCADPYCTNEVLQQAALAAGARSSGIVPATVQIWSAASSNGYCQADAAWGAADGSAFETFLDATNNHGYFGDDQPDIPATGGSVCGVAPLYGSWKYFVAAAGLEAPTAVKPVVTTETGYTDAAGGVPPVDPTTKTKYELRDVLGYFAAGSKYTFLYDLADDFSGSYGITDRYLNPKPAYTALENFIRILQDPGAAYVPAKASYGLSTSSDVSSLLLGKRDGSFWLVLWQQDASFNISTGMPIAVPPAIAQLTFGPMPSALEQYRIDPSSGNASVTRIVRSPTISVAVTDTPEIIQIGTSKPIPLTSSQRFAAR